MYKKIVAATLLLFLLVVSEGQAGPGGTVAPLSTSDLKQAVGTGKNTIVFFINPYGAPCKAQKEILLKLHSDRAKSFNLVYVSTIKPEDQKAFYDYGVRNLPTVVLVNKGGKIGRFFPPGIQSYETLAQALDSAK